MTTRWIGRNGVVVLTVAEERPATRHRGRVSFVLAAVAERLLSGALAAGLLAALLLGVPWGLTRLVGWPLPDQPPDDIWELRALVLQTPYDALFFVRAAACLAWVFWARFAWAVVVELLVTAGDLLRPSRREPRRLSPVHIVAAVLVGSLLAPLCLDLPVDVRRDAAGAGRPRS